MTPYQTLSARPFTDGDLLEIICKRLQRLCFQTKHACFKRSASLETVLQEEEKILVKIYLGNYLLKQVNFNISLAFDDSADMTDTAQMLVFNCGVTKCLSDHEDLLGLVSLHGTTSGLDVNTLTGSIRYIRTSISA